MCVQFMNIKSRSPYGQKHAFIPCGKCEECRDSMRNQWFFRLRSELEWCWKNKFHIGFFTLTYSEDRIPRVPAYLVHNKALLEEMGAPYCFSRTDVRAFIDNIRKRVFEIVGKTKEDKRIRYMICSEYGTDPNRTQRSHYHGLICFPPEVDPKWMFDYIHRLWNVNGFVFPKNFLGGVDSHGHRHEPFLLQGDVSKAARYASKYCTKDLEYIKNMREYVVDTRHEDYKNCKCFHIQSKSIGLSYLSTLPTDRLLDFLRNGVSFVGDTKRRSLPLYLKNKILFNPKYSFERAPDGEWYYDFEQGRFRYSKTKGTHKRIVEKEASAFFYRNIDTIFNMKVEYYAQLFKDMQRESFWKSRVNVRRCNADPDLIARKCYQYSRELSKYDPMKLATGYLAYFGVHYEKCYFTRPSVAYLHRYQGSVYPETLPEFEPWNGKVLLVGRDYYDYIHHGVKWAIQGLKFCEGTDYAKREKVQRISDFYKHAI